MTKETIRPESEDTYIPPENDAPQAEGVPASASEQLAKALQDIESLRADHLRQLAEFENFRKRLNKEKDETIRFANESLLSEIFPVLDSLEMTLSHAGPDRQDDPIVSGVSLTLKQMLQMLQKHGLQELGKIGDDFDPTWHEAIGTGASADHSSGKIIAVHRKGYKLHDRLVRAAMVTVSE